MFNKISGMPIPESSSNEVSSNPLWDDNNVGSLLIIK